ncbi:hypothetical protein Thivi_2965 [Thiocystis violascens DSM 198]|uniref:Uncharacterized protein n=2 Tax=Thiocystis violascens TaxID=73141 RepID=I3YCY8_THIV6|nr:hypothetical protein Thivi_2965 [Thiocystis violascens DSM 198]
MFSATPIRRLLAGSLVMMTLAATGQVAAEASRIELADGSVLSGELVAIEGGRYRIRSATLGEILVPESEIRSIQPDGSASMSQPPASGMPGYGTEIASIQQQLASDPGLMGQISALQNDPEIQAVLSDPELTRLIMSGDLERLRGDARIQRLMAHPGQSHQALLTLAGTDVSASPFL